MASGQRKGLDQHVVDRLDAWGREFCLAMEHRQLGGGGEANIVWRMMHGSGIRSTGPEVSDGAFQIEEIVYRLSKRDDKSAWALRVMHGGRGRVRVERLQLLRDCLGDWSVSLRSFYRWHEIGFNVVRDELKRVRLTAGTLRRRFAHAGLLSV